MVRRSYLAAAAALYLAHTTLLSAVKVKVVMHSEQDDSKIDEEESGASARPDVLERRKRVDSATLLPFLRAHHDYAHPASTAPADLPRSVEERASPPVDRSHPPLHPNDMLFPLIYRQSHINSMFKFGENWYTWSTEKRPDGSRALNYYICYDEPKRCDDVGWVSAQFTYNLSSTLVKSRVGARDFLSLHIHSQVDDMIWTNLKKANAKVAILPMVLTTLHHQINLKLIII